MNDGSVIPSYLQTRATNTWESDLEAFDVNKLLTGEVVEIIYPEDPKNLSKHEIEYTVMVRIKRGPREQAVLVPYRCTAANAFGGADYIRTTFRARQNRTDSFTTTYAPGAVVVLFCVDAVAAAAVIIGGLNNTSNEKSSINQTPKLKDQGHHLEFMFNGVKFRINDDGSCSLNVTGKKDNANRPLGDQIDVKIDVSATGNIAVTDQNSNAIVATENGINVSTPKSNVTIGADGTVDISGSQVNLNGATASAVLGENLKTILNQLTQAITAASFPPTTTAVSASMAATRLLIESTLLSSKVKLE
jgi:hypothetical protein